tara:strand:- start:3640 stop:4659 length:1020 start_codon:yes stop_codon:yes gene_type:complete
MKMKKVNIYQPSLVELTKVDIPKPINDWALVKIHSAPMCTEYKFYLEGKMPPYPLGHEASGEIVDIDKSSQLKIGDRVVVMPQYPCGSCNLCKTGNYIHCQNNYVLKEFTGGYEGDSTFAEYLLKPMWLLPKIPENMNYDHASMLCCGLGPTFGAMEQMNVDSSDTILITGMGPVGLGGIINAKNMGATVIVTAHNEYRAKLATELGADLVIQSKIEKPEKIIRDFTKGNGVDKSIECSGSNLAQRLCLRSTRRKGIIAFVGESGKLDINISNDLIRNGHTFLGIWHYNFEDIPKLFKIAESQKNNLNKLITHRFSFDKVADAFELQISRQCGKIILKP